LLASFGETTDFEAARLDPTRGFWAGFSAFGFAAALVCLAGDSNLAAIGLLAA